ncbi:Cation transport ATPase [Methanocella conradii HZ254]|uniref:Cation transport ATPase n=2 Tax=Methanocella TaxID=570266 RepID=H8I4C6_METCZ|nr:Cation transport ATPase [Methanocella conradii HZ254]
MIVLVKDGQMDKLTISLKEAEKTPVDGLFRRLSTGPDGLSGEEAARRLQVYGPNKMSPLLKSLLNFGRLEDFAIMALLFINVIVKYAQEKKASDACDVLKLLIYGILEREKVELM